MTAHLSYYPDCGAMEEAAHNAEVVRLKSWQGGTPLPAMTAWDWKVWERTDHDLMLDDREGEDANPCLTSLTS